MKQSIQQSEFSDLIVEAVAMYLRRQARQEHPAGRFDKKGRFYLSEVCGRECSIRPPSRAYSYSQMVHGRSLVHCAHALGVSRTESLKLLNIIRKRMFTADERRAMSAAEQDANLSALLIQSADDELARRLAETMSDGRPAGQLRAV